MFKYFFPVNYVKIPPPVTTRWNSICSTLDSMVRLKDVFCSFRDRDHVIAKNDKVVPNLVEVMPPDICYYVYENLLPILKSVEKHSEILSSEKVPTICDVIPAIFRINQKIGHVSY